jgi:hypothetical protein
MLKRLVIAAVQANPTVGAIARNEARRYSIVNGFRDIVTEG